MITVCIHCANDLFFICWICIKDKRVIKRSSKDKRKSNTSFKIQTVTSTSIYISLSLSSFSYATILSSLIFSGIIATWVQPTAQLHSSYQTFIKNRANLYKRIYKKKHIFSSKKKKGKYNLFFWMRILHQLRESAFHQFSNIQLISKLILQLLELIFDSLTVR